MQNIQRVDLHLRVEQKRKPAHESKNLYVTYAPNGSREVDDSIVDIVKHISQLAAIVNNEQCTPMFLQKDSLLLFET